jgi:F0F1-type ATP synthase assembly protein I
VTEPEADRRELGIYFAMAQAGIEMVVPLGVGLWLDHALGSSPWATIGGMILGFVGGTAHLIVLAQRRDEQSKKKGP